LKSNPYNQKEIDAILAILRSNISILSKLNSKFPLDLIKTINDSSDPIRIADLISSVIAISNDDAFLLFKEVNIDKRLLGIIEFMKKEIEELKLKNEISKKVNKAIDKHQKKYFLKEQLKTIQTELGANNDKEKEIVSFKKRLKKMKPYMPKVGFKETKNQISKLSRMHPDSGDAAILQTYVETILDIPFKNKVQGVTNVKDVQEQLNLDHFALDEAKDRIIEFFAVRQ
jgi:ATP-dependent Lon protease